MTEPIERQKFISIIPVSKVNTNCCCGCKLRLGVIVMGIIFIIIHSLQLIGSLTDTFKYVIAAIEDILQCLFIMSYSLLLLSAFNENYHYSQISYMILALLFYLQLAVVSVVSVTLIIRFPLEITAVYLSMYAILLIMKLYFIWIIFSYTKLLKFQKADIVIGSPSNNVDFSYRNVNNNNSLNSNI